MENSLLSRLAEYLRKDKKFQLFNTNTTKRCVPVIAKPRHSKPLISTKTVHFCILFDSLKTPLLAIEVFTYLSFYKTRVEKLVYVSKVDTTGLTISDINVAGFVTEYLKYIVGLSISTLLKDLKFTKNQTNVQNHAKSKEIFVSETHFRLSQLYEQARGNPAYLNKSKKSVDALEYILELGIDPRVLNEKKISTKIVLFTRSEKQYLFPGSVKNKGKHVLDGDSLLKWWLENVDLIVNNWLPQNKFLNVLNLEDAEIRRFFPSPDWKVGTVYDENGSWPAIYNIPLLPDDPKGRFLEHLVVEGRAKQVSLQRYWQELAIRQEFRFGATVGLIGVSGIITTTGNLHSEIITSSSSNQFVELVTSKDYSDKSDWILLYDEIQSVVKLDGFPILGKCERRKRSKENIEPQAINTLFCVRKKKKKKT